MNRTRRAVTLTELLVVLAILSLLATLAVPVYVQKTEQARRATARFETRTIAEAEDQVLLSHGFYVPIHFLDNVADDDAFSGARDDFFSYGSDTSVFFINPYINLFNQEGGGQPTLSDAQSGTNSQAANMISYWSGPFLNPTRVASDPANPYSQNNLSYDTVLDPWGRPYLFFSPIGYIGDRDPDTIDSIDLSNASFTRVSMDSGRLVDDSATAIFDKYAIVSLGANGVFNEDDTQPELSDDIFYTFGFTPNETAFNAF